MDAVYFFQSALRYLRLEATVQVHDLGGTTELADRLEALRDDAGFQTHVASLGVIRDAEARLAVNAFRSVQGALRRAGLPVPVVPRVAADGRPTVSVYILPDCTNKGMLETLCLRSVEDDPALPCLDEYFACLDKTPLPRRRNPDKARLQAFLASRIRSGKLLGQAAEAGYFKWNHPAMTPLLEFLRSL
jgi:hypothetical protein